MLFAFPDVLLALNTAVAGSREPSEQRLASWERAAWDVPAADANKLLVPLWGQTVRRPCQVGQRGGRPSLSILPTRSGLARLPSLEQATPLSWGSWLEEGDLASSPGRLARLSFQFGEEEGNYCLRTTATLVQSFQSSAALKRGTVPFIERWKGRGTWAASTT